MKGLNYLKHIKHQRSLSNNSSVSRHNFSSNQNNPVLNSESKGAPHDSVPSDKEVGQHDQLGSNDNHL
jgi:hypothetical protein